MLTLAAIFGAVGAVLLLVGLVGGGFEFSGSVMPKVGHVSRVLCFAIGGVLLVTSLGLAVVDATADPAHTADGTTPTAVHEGSIASGNEGAQTAAPAQPSSPAVGYVIVGSGYTANVFELPYSDSQIISEVTDGAAVHILCTVQGEAVTSPVTGLSSSLWNFTTDGGFIPDVMVDTGTFQPTMPNCLT